MTTRSRRRTQLTSAPAGGGEDMSQKDAAQPISDTRQKKTDLLQHLPRAILARIWPPERAILGQSVCKWMQEELVPLVDSAMVVRRTGLESKHIHPNQIAQTLGRFVLKDSSSSGIRYERGSVTLKWEKPDVDKLLRGLQAARKANSLVVLAKLDLSGAKNSRRCHVLSDSLSAESAAKLSDILPACPRLTELDLAFNNLGADGGMQAFAAALPGCTRLAKLNLHLNAVGVAPPQGRGAQILAAALPGMSSLRSLDLSSNRLSAFGAFALGPALVGCPALQELELANNNLGAAFVHAILPCAALTSLGLARCRLGDGGAELLGRLLRQCRALAELDVSQNEISAVGAEGLAAGLREAGSLRALNLRSNRVNGRGAGAVVEALRAKGGVKRLNMIGTGFAEAEEGMAGVGALVEGGGVEELKAGLNAVCGVEGAVASVRALGEALGRSRGLRELDLRRTRMGSETEEERERVEALAGGVAQNRGLRRLRLGMNALQEAGMRAWGGVVRSCAELTVLDVGECQLGPEGAGALADALAGAPRVQQLDLRENRLRSQGLCRLLGALAGLRRLEVLCLYVNDIGKEAALALADALQGSAALEEVDLRNQFRLSGDDWEVLSERFRHLRSFKVRPHSGPIPANRI